MKIVFIIIDSIFFLFSFSALPVSVLYFMKSRESWIPPYVGIQITAGAYAVLDILYNGALSPLVPDFSTPLFVTGQTLLRALLLVFIPVFMNRLFDLSGKKPRTLVFITLAAALAALTAVSPKDGGHLAPFYLAGSAAAISLAVYVFITALSIRRRLKPPTGSTNRMFILAGPIYIAYMFIYTLFPVSGGTIFRPVPVSFTNMAYGVWNLIFLWFLVRFITEKHPASARAGSLEVFLEAYEFTEREKDILTMVVDGMGNKQIAFDLGINENTVKAHLYNAYSKIGVHTRVELMNVVYTLREQVAR